MTRKIILPWRLIDGPESAETVTSEIKRTPYRRAPRTSIFGALQICQAAVRPERLWRPAPRHHVSATAPNNMGPPVTIMRDEVLAAASPSTGCRSC